MRKKVSIRGDEPRRDKDGGRAEGEERGEQTKRCYQMIT